MAFSINFSLVFFSIITLRELRRKSLYLKAFNRNFFRLLTLSRFNQRAGLNGTLTSTLAGMQHAQPQHQPKPKPKPQPYTALIDDQPLTTKAESQQLSLSLTIEQILESEIFKARIEKLVADNLCNELLSSSYLANEMAMSPRHFYRKFKDIMNETPSNYVKQSRLKKAAFLLRNTDTPVSNLIFDVGIASRSYFYKAFTAHYGISPKLYREQHMQKSS